MVRFELETAIHAEPRPFVLPLFARGDSLQVPRPRIRLVNPEDRLFGMGVIANIGQELLLVPKSYGQMPAVILLGLPSGGHRLNRRLQQRFSLGIGALGNQLSREAVEPWLVVEFRFHDGQLSQAAS